MNFSKFDDGVLSAILSGSALASRDRLDRLTFSKLIFAWAYASRQLQRILTEVFEGSPQVLLVILCRSALWLSIVPVAFTSRDDDRRGNAARP
ncbi:hypothetical protein BST63_06505 [Bradyrhizobium canariense]|uniref:Uncharacterized protein n=1 Tax=Bradyrhizobium canariense TaxID=255045 RepID=A0ABX3X9U3_9BRAD|nr:hypothetical protein BSR47_26070 [Bradyrhizobium canariense]OSJ33050.1 hypothetical protein BST63_06505 [Bradyrhizobium canariense]